MNGRWAQDLIPPSCPLLPSCPQKHLSLSGAWAGQGWQCIHLGHAWHKFVPTWVSVAVDAYLEIVFFSWGSMTSGVDQLCWPVGLAIWFQGTHIWLVSVSFFGLLSDILFYTKHQPNTTCGSGASAYDVVLGSTGKAWRWKGNLVHGLLLMWAWATRMVLMRYYWLLFMLITRRVQISIYWQVWTWAPSCSDHCAATSLE